MTWADCFDYDRALIPVADAQSRLASHAATVTGTESVSLNSVMGRILADDIVSPRDIPGFANAAVDGWAFAHEDGRREYSCIDGRAAAGHPFPDSVPVGHCLRVLTGAVMPRGTDSVALQEEVELDGSTLRLPKRFKPFANCRPAGEDIAYKQCVLRRGEILRAQDAGALALMGINEVPVFRRLRVGIFSTGDELLQPGEDFVPGRVYDANRFILMALLKRLPVDVSDLGCLPDDRREVTNALLEASASLDLIVTSGGASQGDEDHVAAVMRAQGAVHFWRIALKPGRPLAFGQIGQALLVGLPGNPVAASVCFAFFARPLIQAMGGGAFKLQLPPFADAGFAMHKHKGRTEMVRVYLERTRNGPVARRVPKQGSGVLTSLVDATGLLELGPEIEEIETGMRLPYWDFASLGLA